MTLEEAEKKNVNDVLENAQKYALELQDLLENLREAQYQIETNAERTRSSIEETFCTLRTMTMAALDHRKEQLVAEVCSIQEEALDPLRRCYEVISDKLKITSELVDEGQSIIQKEKCTGTLLENLNRKSATLGSLPEVPHPSQLPCMSFDYDPSISSGITSTVSTFGVISQTSPVQISESYSRPGAIFVCWEEIGSEKEAIEFRLQSAQGDARKTEPGLLKFVDVYRGSETSFLMKDVKPEVACSFRVCSRVEENSCWSAWSMPFVTSTSLPPYEWEPQNENYSLSQENKLATKVTSMPSILFSKSSQFRSGHSLRFEIFENHSSDVDEGIGLAQPKALGKESMLFPGFIFVNVDGTVHVDGNEMTTRLPPLGRGSTLVFESEGLPNNKIRIVIECEGKTVIYDWKLDKENKDQQLYFIALFKRKGWKILVS